MCGRTKIPYTVKSRVLMCVTNTIFFVKRSQYISIEYPLHDQSEKVCKCFKTRRASTRDYKVLILLKPNSDRNGHDKLLSMNQTILGCRENPQPIATLFHLVNWEVLLPELVRVERPLCLPDGSLINNGLSPYWPFQLFFWHKKGFQSVLYASWKI